MNTNLIDDINNSVTKFTRAEKKVAEYVLANVSTVSHMSIKQLSENCGVAEATVFRFCKTINYPGFSAFKIKAAQTDAINSKSIVGCYEDLKMEDKTDVLSTKLILGYKEIVDNLYSKLSYRQLEQCNEILCSSRRIFFWGSKSSILAAEDAAMRFSRITNKIVFSSNPYRQEVSISLITSEDVLVAFPHTANDIACTSVMKKAASCGSKIVCLTEDLTSEAARLSTVCLQCVLRKDAPFEGASFSVRLSQMLLIDLVYAMYFRKNYPESYDNLKRCFE